MQVQGRSERFVSLQAPAIPLDDRSKPAGPSPALRARVYMTRGKLDREIAGGRLCESSAALALRARQLVSPRERRHLARDLRGAVAYVDRVDSRPTISAVVIDRAAVRSARQAIVRLAERLEGWAPVSPRGVARVSVLLTDGLSPLFNPNSAQSAIEAMWEIDDALEVSAFDPVIG